MKANLKNGWRVVVPDKLLMGDFYGNPVRVAMTDNDWYFVLSDICHAIGIKDVHVLSRDIPAKWQLKVRVDVGSTDAKSQDIGVDRCNKPVKSITGGAAHNSHVYTCINEFGVYEALGKSRKLEARQFREWTYEVLSTLRKKEGIATYSLGKLLEKETQDQILDHVNKAKYEGWDMYYDKVTDWWWIEKMTGGGDITFVPVDDPYGRPFKWLEYDPTYEPSFDTNDPDIKRPCPYYN